jgi:hypothetical protein
MPIKSSLKRVLTRVVLLALPIILYALLSSPVHGDHWSQSNISNHVNYWVVEEGQLRVCDNSALGHATFQNHCAYPQVWGS